MIAEELKENLLEESKEELKAIPYRWIEVDLPGEKDKYLAKYSCRYCFGTGIYGHLLHQGKSRFNRVPIACKCIKSLKDLSIEKEKI